MLNIRGLILLLLGLSLAAGLPAAALDEPVPGSDPDYRSLRELQGRFGSAPLPAAGASRGEMALSLAALAADAGAAVPGGDWKVRDYDALYALVQQYREELRSMGFEQKQLEDSLAALKLKAHELQARLDKLQPKDGLKIHGKVSQIYDDMILFGPGWGGGSPLRYRHGLGRALLDFTFTRGIFSGLVEYGMQSELTNDWGNCPVCQAGVTTIFMEVRTPLALQIGDIDAKLSPLTFWRNDDEHPFEPKLFSDRREDQLEELKLKPSAQRLKGLRLATDLVFFSSRKLKLQAMLFQLGQPGQVMIRRGGLASSLSGDAPAGEGYTLVYSTYMGAWRAALPFESAELAYNAAMIRDAPDTAVATYSAGALAGQRVKGFDSQVHAGELEFRLASLSARLKAEAAASLFSSPSISPTFSSDYLTGTAMTASLEFSWPLLDLKAGYRDVSDGFISAPAQGRSQDAEDLPLGPFITENSLYNVNRSTIGPSFGVLGFPEPPESRFNTALVPPQVVAGGAYLPGYRIPYDHRVNAISPYGLATPNRSGFRLDLGARLWKQGLKLMATADSAQEKQKQAGQDPSSFIAYRGGAVLDLQPILGWALALSGGYSVNDLRNGAKVAFSSTIIDLGIDWKMLANLTWSAGARHLDGNGTLAYQGTDPDLQAFGYVSHDQVYDLGGIGLKWDFAEMVNLRLGYSSLIYTNKKPGGLNWQADQGYGRVNIVF